MFTRFHSAAIGSLLAVCLLPTSAHGQIIPGMGNPPMSDPPVGLIPYPTTNPGLLASPTDPYSRADALRKEGKYDEALQAINEALKHDPDCGKCYGLRSGILGSLQHYAEGAADGDIGIKLSKTSRYKAMSAYNKGFNLTSLDRKTEALDAYRLAVKFDPTYAPGHFGLGKIYYLLFMWREAKAELEQAIALDPKPGAAWAYRAETQYRLGSLADGIASAEKAVELSPNDSRSFRARAIGHQLSDRFEEMLVDATRAVEIDPTRPLAHLLRGRAFGLLGRLDEALAEYALETDRKAVEPYLNGVHQAMYGTRLYNCGIYTELETPEHVTMKGFEECKARAMQGLADSAVQSTPPPTRKTVPGLPTKRPIKK